MNEDFVTFEQAVELKSFGFNWECSHLYDEDKELIEYDFHQEFYHEDLYADCILAPTLSQAQKWLREKHNLIILVDTYFKNYMEGDYSKAEFEYVMVYMNLNAVRKESSKDDKLFESYEQALSAGIDRAIEYLKAYKNE